MLNRHQLKEYRLLRGVSVRDVANYSDISPSLVTQVEKGDKIITEYNHKQIVDGINAAYSAKKNGTLVKGDNVKVKETDSKPDSDKKAVKEDTEKKQAKKKTTAKKSTKKKEDKE